MSVSQEIIDNVKKVRNAAYGKDVREAIAKGLELCYGYTSGETAIEAAERANAAAEVVEDLIDDSRQAVEDAQQALEDVDAIIKVSSEQPTEPTNKIWIQPQDNTEYKVATFAAYEALWSRMNEINQTYEQGHGGIVSITLDSSYIDLSDTLKKRYEIAYSDGTIGEFFVDDGPTGPVGPVDQITGTSIHYKKVPASEFTPTPPTTYVDNIPTLNSGDYLWTITEINYASGAQAYLYGLTRIGIDGSGAVNSVAIGQNGTTMVGDVKLPVDSSPTSDSGNLLTSGTVHSALSSKANLDSPNLTGAPTAPTPANGDDSTRIATTEFVQDALTSNLVASWQVSLTMNQKTLTYTNSDITENTAVLGFTNLDYGKIPGLIRWETTSDHKLILSMDSAPTQNVTFKAILTETKTA